MSNCWRKGSPGRIVLAALALGLAALACAGPYADLDARLQGRPDTDAVAGLRGLAADGEEDAQNALLSGPRASRAYVHVRALLEGESASKLPAIDAASGDERIASSWLGRALSRLHPPKFDEPEMRGMPSVGIGPWATVLMWGVLIALAGVAIYFLVQNVRLPASKRRRKMVDEEEPIRSADVWLEEANGLIVQGRYREAVRGLYVAGLMRFDEANVARFDRHQTNWEHLRRIEASARRPEGVEARTATGLFDRCWYGRLPTTPDDAADMRAWYDGIVAKLAEGSVA